MHQPPSLTFQYIHPMEHVPLQASSSLLHKREDEDAHSQLFGWIGTLIRRIIGSGVTTHTRTLDLCPIVHLPLTRLEEGRFVCNVVSLKHQD
jgi:hypothetical protein